MRHVQQGADSETSLNYQLDTQRQRHCAFHLESRYSRIPTWTLGLQKNCEEFRIYQDIVALSIDKQNKQQP